MAVGRVMPFGFPLTELPQNIDGTRTFQCKPGRVGTLSRVGIVNGTIETLVTSVCIDDDEHLAVPIRWPELEDAQYHYSLYGLVGPGSQVTVRVRGPVTGAVIVVTERKRVEL